MESPITVADLINLLRSLPQDAEVVTRKEDEDIGPACSPAAWDGNRVFIG